MYPVLFTIGGLEITSFGVLVALGALAGVSMFRRELLRRGLPENAVDGAIVGVIAGLAGAKLLWVFEHLGEEPFTSLLFSRGGLSWFGGLVGGVGAALLYFVIRGYPLVPTIAAATPALAAGHGIGRIGCFLVGDDYGEQASDESAEPAHPAAIEEERQERALRQVLEHVEEFRAQEPADQAVDGRVERGVGKGGPRQLLAEQPESGQRAERHHHAEAGDLERADAE